MKKITIYSASVVETGGDHPFGWSVSSTSPEDLAKKVEDILRTEEGERGITIRKYDHASLVSCARYGSQGEPEVFNVEEDDDVAFVTNFSGPTVLDIPDGSDDKGALMAPPAGKEEIIAVHLGIVNYPRAYNAKVEELVEEDAFPTETEARSWVREMPITLELIYEKGHGLFAVESEAVDAGGIVSPYTGKEIVTPENA